MPLAGIEVEYDPIVLPLDEGLYLGVTVRSTLHSGSTAEGGYLWFDFARPRTAEPRILIRRQIPTIASHWEPLARRDDGYYLMRVLPRAGRESTLVWITPRPDDPTDLRCQLVGPEGSPIANRTVTWSTAGKPDPAARQRLRAWVARTQLVDLLGELVSALSRRDGSGARQKFRAARQLAYRIGHRGVLAALQRYLRQPDIEHASLALDVARGLDDVVFGRGGGYAPPSVQTAPPESYAQEATHVDAFPARFEQPMPQAGSGRGARPVPASVPGAMAQIPSGAAPTAEPEAVVNTGFADPAASWEPFEPDQTLCTGQDYLFWLEIDAADQRSIERTPMALPAELPAQATVTVALFDFPGEVELRSGASVGQLRLRPRGAAEVLRQPLPVLVDHWPGTRLAFPVRMPARSGTARLRCNLYFNQVLVQSRLVQVMVTQRTRRMPDALRSVVDFRIADPATSLADTTIAHAASLHLEGDGRGTHELRVVADGGTELLCAGATIRDGQLATQIKLARSALQRVAWGTDTPWREGLVYRYATPAPYAQLTSDLINLAVNGFRLHHLLLRGLGQTRGTSAFDMACTLGKALRRPGYVQFALRDGAQHVLPAALLYDLPLDTQAPRIQVCADFEAAMRAGQVLGAPCFGGTCRQVDDPDDTVVCPGGFWGYRHALGLPVSVGPAAGLPSHLDGRDGGWLTGGVYCDFQLVDEHRTALLHLLPGLRIELAENRRQTFDALREIQPHVVYFYCHGGVERAVPYLRVGRGTTEPVITPDNLFHKGIRWAEHRPLVFLNGCRTTDLSPESAIEFVSFFVQDAWACGVIGTEITVFESLAAEFAEECLRGFLAHGLPIGLAVRQARIALLARGNPLGLAYVPFVAPAIQFRRNHKEFDRAA